METLQALNLPPFEVKIRPVKGKRSIWDMLRQQFVALTPEEWVRQHFIHYLIAHKGYPKGLLANEVAVSLHATKKRCDSVLYDRQLRARMIIEYKAPTIEITQKVFDQITRYNMVLHVEYLVVSNGLKHYCCRVNCAQGTYVFLPEVPDYDAL